MLDFENQLKFACVCKEIKGKVETYWQNTQFMKIDNFTESINDQLLEKCKKVSSIKISKKLTFLVFYELKILDLTGCTVVYNFSSVPLPNLEVLILDKVKYMKYLADKCIFTQFRMYKLTVLSLAYCSRNVFSDIVSGWFNGSMLKHLNLYGLEPYERIRMVLINSTPNLTYLNIGGTNTDYDTIPTFYGHLMVLEELVLSDSPNINDYCLETLLKHPTLKTLEIRNCPRILENMKNKLRDRNIEVVDYNKKN